MDYSIQATTKLDGDILLKFRGLLTFDTGQEKRRRCHRRLKVMMWQGGG